jgi:RNA-directed DNA polymerase
VPTVADRVAQMVVKQLIEPDLDPIFLADSYGYRPRKSALDAIGVTRKRCWKYDWVLEFDIKGLFDNIDHELLLRAVRKHVTCKWALLYIKRWLTAPIDKDGIIIERTRGTPQGGVISPMLSNLFLHYTFDLWMGRAHPDLPWCRYADDGLVHCRSEQEAEALKAELQTRLAECGLEMHLTKTKIVYCKDSRRKGSYSNVKFDFLGYCFRPRRAKNSQDASVFCSFLPGVSASVLKSMRAAIRDLNLRGRTHVSMADIARQINPLLRGWIEYYGRFTRAALGPILRYVNQTIEAWMSESSNALWVARPRPAASSNDYLENVPGCSHTGRSAYAARSPDGSPVRRESHAGIYERPAVRFHRPTRQICLSGSMSVAP